MKIRSQIEKHIVICSSYISKNLLQGCSFAKYYCTNIMVVLDVMICSLARMYQHFIATCCLNLQNRFLQNGTYPSYYRVLPPTRLVVIHHHENFKSHAYTNLKQNCSRKVLFVTRKHELYVCFNTPLVFSDTRSAD